MSTTKTDPKIAEVMESLTQQVIASIEAGMADPKGWKAPWHSILAGSVNAVTHRRYNGGNAIMLGFMGDGPWATYKQWATVGAQVRKGEKGVTILVPVPVKFEKENRDGKKEAVRFIKYRTATVFASSQVDGWNAPDVATNSEPRTAEADALIEAWSRVVPINHIPGNQAYYRKDIDAITLPPFDQFKNATGFYNTVLHEIGHSTGHADRLDRPMGNVFGSPDYAKEELVAELTAAFLGQHFGIQTETVSHDNADYLANWLQALRNDTNLLWDAATKAQKAVALVLSVLPDSDGE